MTQNDKKTLGNLLSLGVTILGIYFWTQTQLGGAVGFFVILTVTLTVPPILISRIIPTKSNKKSKKMKTKTQN